MANFGQVKRVTASVGGREITFRSKLEYRWCVWCELRKQNGLIKDWWYEDQDSLLEMEPSVNSVKKVIRYLPDFTILMNNGDYEFEETKGYFPAKDYTKMKLATEQYDTPITLIFAYVSMTPKKPKGQAQLRRIKRIEPHMKHVIWDASKSIFKKIEYLFDY